MESLRQFFCMLTPARPDMHGNITPEEGAVFGAYCRVPPREIPDPRSPPGRNLVRDGPGGRRRRDLERRVESRRHRADAGRPGGRGRAAPRARHGVRYFPRPRRALRPTFAPAWRTSGQTARRPNGNTVHHADALPRNPRGSPGRGHLPDQALALQDRDPDVPQRQRRRGRRGPREGHRHRRRGQPGSLSPNAQLPAGGAGGLFSIKTC